MRDPGSKPQPDPPSGAAPEPEEGSALWALLVGGAILVIAALLIFWPSGDSGTAGGKSGIATRRPGDPASQSLAQGGAPGQGGGMALGVEAREYDPHRGGGGQRRVNPIFLPEGTAGTTLAPPKKPKPEPTSFPSASAEIAYWEKKLDLARDELSRRTMFWERMQRAKEEARTSEQIETAERRSKIVEKNYLDQKKIVEDLEKKVADLKEKQRQTGNP
ncbi:MAG TPA: hypothetical protein VIK91_10175 [Nannocystis sp.]